MRTERWYLPFGLLLLTSLGSTASAQTQTPYLGTNATIANGSTIQAENYDVGGEGIAYHDTTAGNTGGQYRTDGVDLEVCTDTGGGFNAGWLIDGEWLEYTTNTTAGTYTITARVASAGAAVGDLRVVLDGAVLGTLAVNATGGWQTYADVSLANVVIAGGSNRIFRLEVVNGGDFNVNSVRFASTGATPTPTATVRATPTPTQPPTGCATFATCEAETALLGGSVVTSTLHAGFTGSGFADYQGNGTGFVEWTVNVPAAGTYNLNIRYGNGGTGDRPMSIQVNGTTVVASMSFPVTGWTTWTVRTQAVTLPAGSVRIRATELPNGPNVDNLVVTSTGGTATPTATSTATPTATTRSTPTATPRSTATPTATSTVGPTPTTGPSSNLALGKVAAANTVTQTFVAANANDDNVTTYWESAGFPGTLTVPLGANANLSSVVIKLNPDPIWGLRTQTIQVLGRPQTGGSYTSLAGPTLHTFNPASNANSVPISVSGAWADVQVNVTTNSGAPGAQVAECQIFGTWAPNPDLTVTNATWSPGAPDEATSITLSATVQNIGSAAAAATTLNFSLAGSVVGSANVPALNAGASATVSLNAGQRAQGSYSVSATVDPNNTIIETNNANNTFTAGSPMVVAQAPGPDLQVTNISWNPTNPAVGAGVTFTVSVNNRGTMAVAAGSTTRVVAGSTTLNNTNTPAINAGATVNVSVGTWTATSGGAAITATADAGGILAETNESNNSLSTSVVVGRGAAVPWTEYEAENANYTGTLLTTDALRTFGHTNFATESSGRQSVRLNSQGQYVEFTSTAPANSIVIRNSIPDAAGGGGTTATISLYINGTFLQKIMLSSRHSWLYGTSDDPEGLSQTPSADARRLFDESNALLGTSYPVGTRWRLQRDAGDNASFYVIDLIDLEQVAPAMTAIPAGFASITSYGAIPNDGLEDTAAIQAAVNAAQAGTIGGVWIPAGRWRQEKKILTDDPLNRGTHNQVGIRNVKVRGAGMWHSIIHCDLEPQNAPGLINHPHEGNCGFDIDENTQISDLAIFGGGTIRGNNATLEGGVGLNGRFGNNTAITNVWLEHHNVGAWVGRDYTNIPELWGPANNVLFSGCRIRNTYADGVNFTNGSHDSRVFNTHFRNNGDDAMAVWASKYVRDPNVDIGRNNQFMNNTVQLVWRANGIAIYGGANNRAENNIISDTMNYPGIMLATDHDPVPFSGTTTLANNQLNRCGGAFWNEDQEFGAITLFPSNLPIPGVVIRDTEILDSTYDGIQFKTGGGEMPGVSISNTRIDRSNNGAGILAMGGARGTATLSNVTITNSNDGNIVIQPGSTFTITGQ